MKIATSLLALGITAALSGVSQSSFAAQEKEIDSAFQWGRWAVLSPAAGNPAYQAVAFADAGNSVRDDILTTAAVPGIEQPPVDPPGMMNGSCVAGGSCGYATYSSLEGEISGTGNGPLLANFSETSTSGGDQRSFTVTDTGDVNFPDVQSVDLNEDNEGFWSGTGVSQTTTNVLNEAGSKIETTTTQSSGIQDVEVGNFDGVETGFWNDSNETTERFVSTDEDLQGATIPLQVNFQQSGGFFAHGITATLDQMQSFIADHVSASYQGRVLGFGSAVTLQFNFGNGSFHGNFANGNGFNGFEIDGSVQGVNFVATDGANGVTGSFFNEGLNASGAVNNATQLGVFSTDFITP